MAEPSGLRQQGDLRGDLAPILWSSLEVGSFTGVSGLLFGSVVGVLKSANPTIFAIVSGIQWFTFGSTFWATRSILAQPPRSNQGLIHTTDKIYASGIAGGVAGSAAGLLRGRSGVIPGAIMFAVFGTAGQALYNMADTRQSAILSNPNNDSGWLDSKWSPVKVLSDDEYESMLQEKLLRIEADIALVDENIMKVRNEEIQIGRRRQNINNGQVAKRL